MNIYIKLCLSIIISTATASPSQVAPTKLLVTRVGPCYDSPKTMVTISEMILTRKQYDSSVSGWLNISEDIDNGWKVKATMQKCHDIRNLDTCDYFRSFSVIKSGCTDDDAQDEDFYSMFFHYIHPKLQCPVKAGSYEISNYPFFTEGSDLTVAESKISTSVFGYTYRVEGYLGLDKRILCVEAILQMLYVRDHNWASSKKFDFFQSSQNDTEAVGDDSDQNGDDV